MKTRRGFLQAAAALVAGLFCPKPAPPKQIVSTAILTATPGAFEAAGLGMSIRFIQRYDAPTDRIISRMDAMSYWPPDIKPEYACRIAS